MKRVKCCSTDGLTFFLSTEDAVLPASWGEMPGFVFTLQFHNSNARTDCEAVPGHVLPLAPLACSPAFEAAHCPDKPRFTSTLTSTRRLSARPFAVSFGAAGSASPIAPGATMCRTGMLQS